MRPARPAAGRSSFTRSETDAYAQSDYVAWTTHFYTDCCKLSATRVYHTIPATGGGAAGANYDETTFGYDLRDRRNRTVSPGGTIAFTVFDVRSLPTAAYVGADDTGATAADPSGGGAGGNDMVLVSSNEYDGGTAGGDGNLTRTLAHVDAATARTTRFEYDWRNRRVATAGEEHAFVRRTLDNLGRVVRTERRVGSDAGRLLAKSETLRNDRGRTYRTLTYPVDPASGAAGTPAADRAWYDAAGNVIKSLPGGAETFSRSVYDGLGRATAEYVGFETGQTGLGSLAAATVLTQTETVHDAASNVLATTGRDRYDDATGTGPLGGPTGAGPNARVTYAAAWHDPVGRTTAAADYGTHGGAGLVRPDAVPARSDDALVSSTSLRRRRPHGLRDRPGRADDRLRPRRGRPPDRGRREPRGPAPLLVRRRRLPGLRGPEPHDPVLLHPRRAAGDPHRRERRHRRPGDDLRVRHDPGRQRRGQFLPAAAGAVSGLHRPHGRGDPRLRPAGGGDDGDGSERHDPRLRLRRPGPADGRPGRGSGGRGGRGGAARRDRLRRPRPAGPADRPATPRPAAGPRRPR